MDDKNQTLQGSSPNSAVSPPPDTNPQDTLNPVDLSPPAGLPPVTSTQSPIPPNNPPDAPTDNTPDSPGRFPPPLPSDNPPASPPNQDEPPPGEPEEQASVFLAQDQPKGKGKIFAAIAAIVLLIAGAGAGVLVLNRNTEIREKAAEQSDSNHCAAFDGYRKTAGGASTNIVCEGWQKDKKDCESDQMNPYYFNSCRNTGANTSDASHCARFDGKRQIQGQVTNVTCTGWDQNNKSCEADQENPYYFATCQTVESQPAPASGGSGTSSSDHCAGQDGKRRVGAVITNIVCENKVASNTSCQSDSENPAYYNLCRNTGENPSDFNHCARFDGKRQIQGVATNIVCEGWDQNNKSCIADQENPYYFNLCRNTKENPSDAAHCADFEGKRMIQGKPSGITCTSWVKDNKSCIADQENPYYFQTCTGATGGTDSLGDSRCTELQIVRGGTVIVGSQVQPGDTITLRAYCYSAENETFDKFRFNVSIYQGATSTNDVAATRASEKDQANKKFYSASHSFTTEAAQYTVKVWGHTVSKGWKGK